MKGGFVKDAAVKIESKQSVIHAYDQRLRVVNSAIIFVFNSTADHYKQTGIS